MSKGRTGIEIIKSWFTPAAAPPPNPLNTQPGAHARLNNIIATVRGEQEDLTNELFTITNIVTWDRKRHGTPLPPFTDYILDSDNKRLTLRVTRNKNDHELLLLTQHWPESDEPYPWGEDSPHIIKGLQDPKGEFTRYKDTPQEEVYYRDLNNAHCTATITPNPNETEPHPYSLWTFRRNTTILENNTEQHLHAQLSGHYNEKTAHIDGGDRTILILRGETIPILNVTIY